MSGNELCLILLIVTKQEEKRTQLIRFVLLFSKTFPASEKSDASRSVTQMDFDLLLYQLTEFLNDIDLLRLA